MSKAAKTVRAAGYSNSLNNYEDQRICSEAL